MRKIIQISLVLLLLAFSVSAWAQGIHWYLVSDPSTDGATVFKLKINGTDTNAIPVVNNAVRYEVTGSADGTTFQAAFGKPSKNNPAVTIWSEWAPSPDPFIFYAEGRTSAPSGFSIEVVQD